MQAGRVGGHCQAHCTHHMPLTRAQRLARKNGWSEHQPQAPAGPRLLACAHEPAQKGVTSVEEPTSRLQMWTTPAPQPPRNTALPPQSGRAAVVRAATPACPSCGSRALPPCGAGSRGQQQQGLWV